MPQVDADPLSTTTCGLLLASIGDAGYVIPARRELAAGLAAAVLVELSFHRRVGADGGRILVTDAAPTGEAVIDPVLDSLATRRRAPDVGRCLEELSLDWTILGRAAHALEQRGLIRVERRALHPLIMHRLHPVDADAPGELRSLLDLTAAGDRSAAAPREVALAALAGAIGLLRERRAELPDVPEAHADTSGVLSAVARALAALTQRPASPREPLLAGSAA